MRPMSITAYLVEAHHQDLLREARQAALAAGAQAGGDGLGTAALLLTSDLLLAAGHRLRAHLAHRPLAQSRTLAHHPIPCAIVPACRLDGARSAHAACLEA